MQTKYQRVKEVGALPNSGCGLDKNLLGEYTLGCYTPKTKEHPWGIYLQLKRATAEEIHAVAKRLKFVNIIDRIHN
jgi:hypothetical protein